MYLYKNADTTTTTTSKYYNNYNKQNNINTIRLRCSKGRGVTYFPSRYNNHDNHLQFLPPHSQEGKICWTPVTLCHAGDVT